MPYTSDRPIVVDGVRLDTLAWNIEKITRTVAARVESNVQVPGRDGVIASLNDNLEATMMGLDMFVQGTDEDGAVPVEGRRDRLWANLDELIHLFGKRHALLEVREQTGPGEYVRNRATNPNWQLATGPQNVNIIANQFKNPLPVSLTGYVQANGATLTYDAAQAGIRVTVPAGGPTDVGVNVAGTNAATVVSPGEVWTFAVEVEAVTACSPRLSIQGIGVTFSYLPGSSAWSQMGQPVTLTPGQKVRLVATLTVTTGGAHAAYVLRSLNTDAQEFIVRKVMATRTPVPIDYFDGTRREGRWASADMNVAWSGATDGSMSYVRGNRQPVSAIAGVGQNLNASAVVSTAPNGTPAVRLVPTNTSGTNDTFLQVGDYSSLNRFRPGVTYTISATLHIAAPMRSAAVHMRPRSLTFWHRVGTGSYTIVTAMAPDVVGSHRLSVRFKMPEGTTEAWVRLYHGGAAGDVDHWWSGLTVSEGTVTDAGPVSGAETATPTYAYRWLGEANDSESERVPISTRRAWAKVTDAITPELNEAGSAGRFTVGLEIPAGCWEDVDTQDWSGAAGAASGTVQEVTTLRGATERITDAIIVVTGPATNPRVTDPATGAYVELQGAITAAQGWRVNVGTWATRYGGLSFASSDVSGTDAQAITRFGGTRNQSAFLPLVPTRAADGTRRVSVALSGQGFSAATKVSIRARRKFAL